MRIVLPTLDATERFGAAVAATLSQKQLPALLLYGDLGVGKTTFVRSLVKSLPGAETAEISSPSFTIYNIYCTTPKVHHFDLYRLETGALVDELAEAFDTPSLLTLVEWAERIHPQDMPFDGISCTMTVEENSRVAVLAPLGDLGTTFLQALKKALAL